VILVRHALPQVRPDVPSRDWTLGDEGRAQAEALCRTLPDGITAVYASDEPKAIATVEPLGLEVRVDPRFGEVERPWIGDDYRAHAARYLREDADGWEPRDEVLARFGAAVDDLPPHAVVATHGLAMSLYLASHHDIDVVAFWSDLRFPDAWRIEALERVP